MCTEECFRGLFTHRIQLSEQKSDHNQEVQRASNLCLLNFFSILSAILAEMRLIEGNLYTLTLTLTLTGTTCTYSYARVKHGRFTHISFLNPNPRSGTA